MVVVAAAMVVGAATVVVVAVAVVMMLLLLLLLFIHKVELCILSGFLYGCQTWTITKDLERRNLVFERNCHRKIMKIRWVEMTTNEELYQRIPPKVLYY